MDHDVPPVLGHRACRRDRRRSRRRPRCIGLSGPPCQHPAGCLRVVDPRCDFGTGSGHRRIIPRPARGRHRGQRGRPSAWCACAGSVPAPMAGRARGGHRPRGPSPCAGRGDDQDAGRQQIQTLGDQHTLRLLGPTGVEGHDIALPQQVVRSHGAAVRRFHRPGPPRGGRRPAAWGRRGSEGRPAGGPPWPRRRPRPSPAPRWPG